MPRRIKKSRSFLGPLADNLKQRLKSTDTRVRRRIIKISFWVIVLLFMHSLVSGTYGIPRIIRLELERRSLIEANRELTADLVLADRRKRLLRSDSTFIEYIARTKYRMVRPGETIYRYRGR
jgi:cell division protein FtsB